MEAEKRMSQTERQDRRRGRAAFFSWFFALFGMGTGLLALLLIGAGEIPWSSPVGLVLLALTAVGLVCLGIVLAGLFRARGKSRGAGGR